MTALPIERSLDGSVACQKKRTQLLKAAEVRPLLGYNVLDVSADSTIVTPGTPKAKHVV